MPELEDVKTRILGAFAQFGVGAGEYLPAQSLLGRTASWPPPERNLVPRALEQLVAEGQIELLKSPHGYRLAGPAGEGSRR